MKLCDVTECPSPLACDTKDYTQALQDYTQALTNDRGWLRDSAEKRTLDEQHPMPTEDRSRRLALALYIAAAVIAYVAVRNYVAILPTSLPRVAVRGA